MKMEVEKQKKEPGHYKLTDWLVKQKSSLEREAIGEKILEFTDSNEIRSYEFGGWITKATLRMEQKYGCTLVYINQEMAYRVVKKGSFEASRFTMEHYRRAVLSAARAQELNDLGFLDPKHIHELVEKVFSKTSRRTKELSSLKKMLVEKWRLLKTQERKQVEHG